MRTGTALLGLVITLGSVAVSCGHGSKPPITGADLVATAVSARYVVSVDSVTPTADGFEWLVTAANGSAYTWRGTLYIRLVDTANKIIQTEEFAVPKMVPPGGKTASLKFQSPYAPAEMGGVVARIKVEVDVAAYEEPPAAGGGGA